jgi:hypothetical protein
MNPPAWSNLEGEQVSADAKMEDVVETPLVPNESASTLSDKGFAQPQA